MSATEKCYLKNRVVWKRLRGLSWGKASWRRCHFNWDLKKRKSVSVTPITSGDAAAYCARPVSSLLLLTNSSFPATLWRRDYSLFPPYDRWGCWSTDSLKHCLMWQSWDLESDDSKKKKPSLLCHIVTYQAGAVVYSRRRNRKYKGLRRKKAWWV